MALTPLQSKVLRLLAENRRKTPGSYVAGGTAFNLAMNAPRLSRDVDVFHDSTEAMFDSWRRDRQTLEANGFDVRPLRELPTFIEARIVHAEGTTEIQWGIDSAYRFFPLVEREDTGFTLHPLDLAANKLAALVGRTEPRDWIDVITASKRLQPFACLLSAACGKDPGFSPISMLEYVARRHYNQTEIDDNIMPRGIFDAAELCRYWHGMIERTKRVLEVFPHAEAGKAVMTAAGELFNGTDDELVAALKAGSLTFHEGHIGGAWPRIIR